MNYDEEFQRAQALVKKLCEQPDTTRDVVATAYVSVLVASMCTHPQGTDVTVANRAILERWSANALAYIKGRAWEIIETARPPVGQ